MKDTHQLPTVLQGDLIQIAGHIFDAGNYQLDTLRKATGRPALLTRPAGCYRVLRKFRSGNVFAIYTGFTERGCDPQVIQPKHILGKVDEQRRAA